MNTQVTSSGKATPTQEQIAVAAYYLYAQNGFRDGCAQEDWFRAEQMLCAAPEISAVQKIPIAMSMPGSRAKSKKKNGTI